MIFTMVIFLKEMVSFQVFVVIVNIYGSSALVKKLAVFFFRQIWSIYFKYSRFKVV